MRIRVTTILLALVCLAAAQLRAGSAEQSASITGNVSTVNGAITLDGTAVGSLAGTFRITVRTSGERAESGEWTLATDAGLISGTVVGGAVGFGADGHLVGVNDMKLRISSGTGAYAGAAEAAGTMTVRFTSADAFDADLSLGF